MSLENQGIWNARKKDLYQKRIKELNLRSLDDVLEAEDEGIFDDIDESLEKYRVSLNKTAQVHLSKKELLPLLSIPLAGAAAATLVVDQPSWMNAAKGAYTTTDNTLHKAGIGFSGGGTAGAILGALLAHKTQSQSNTYGSTWFYDGSSCRCRPGHLVWPN